LIKIGRSFWVVLIIMVACLVTGTLTPDKTDATLYYRLALLWALLIMGSWLWSFFALRGVIVRRQARTLRQQVGQIFEERFEVINTSIISRLWIEILDESTLPGSGGSRILTWIGGRQSRSYLAYTLLTHRGQYQLSPTQMLSGDIFGIFKVSKQIENNVSLLVLPHTVDLHSFPIPQGLLPGGRALRRKTLEVTPYAAGVREYAPGDPLNRIHWGSTARHDRLMVKEFEQELQAEVWILVDAQQSVQAALPESKPILRQDTIWWTSPHEQVTLPPSSIEYIVSITASVANYYLRLGREVGLAIAGQMQTIISAERGERQVGKIMETLALLESLGNLPLSSLVHAQAGHIPMGSTVVVVSTSSQPELMISVSELIHRRMHPMIVIIETASFGGRDEAKEIIESFNAQGIPAISIANGDPLNVKLEGMTRR
jgi:uncharacterized protein (DUF58 family)